MKRVGFLVFALCAVLAGRMGIVAHAQEGRAKAVLQVLDEAPECQDLGDAYWEIGDSQGVLAQGQRGQSIGPETDMPIASASKWVFAAYVLQRMGSTLSEAEVLQLQLRSGYDRLNPVLCLNKETPAQCFAAGGNDKLSQDHIGMFSYNGGHMQKTMIDLGLGDMDLDDLTTDLNRKLGLDAAFRYGTPQAAAGMRATPKAYGAFLRRILLSELRMASFLGSMPVCTLPGSCPTAFSSPAPMAWHYSLGHWVEDDPEGDGAFSSAGAFGFYPWISADRRLYGLLARKSYKRNAGVQSALCGRAIRRAFEEDSLR